MDIRLAVRCGAVLLLVVAVMIVGCGKKEEPRVEPPAQAPAPPPTPSVASMTFAKGVDINWSAVSPTAEFKASDRINVTIRTENIVPGSTLGVRWMYLGSQQLVKADSVVLMETGLNNSAFFIERGKGFPPGAYRLDAFLNGALAKSAEFTVVR